MSETEAPAPKLRVDLVPLVPVPAELKRRPWLVEDLLLYGAVTALGGQGGAGKSMLALQIAIAVALGERFADWAPEGPRKVLILNAEDDVDELRRRILAACAVMGVATEDLADRLFATTAKSLTLLRLRAEKKSVTLEPTALAAEVDRLLSENPDIGLIVLDPLVELSEGVGENDNALMKDVMVRLRGLARKRNVALLVVAHSRKGGGTDQDAIRGGSAIVNACRVALVMERMTEKEAETIEPPESHWHYAKVVSPKMNYGEAGNRRWLRFRAEEIRTGDWVAALEPVEFGLDDGFDPETWCHRAAFLKLVRDGCREEGKEPRPWAVSKKSHTARLDKVLPKRFEGVTAEGAEAIIAAFAKAGYLVEEEWEAPNRGRRSTVWRVAEADPRPDGGQDELAF